MKIYKIFMFKKIKKFQHSKQAKIPKTTKKMIHSEFTKNQNGAVNVSNWAKKCSILLNYRLLHISKVV